MTDAPTTAPAPAVDFTGPGSGFAEVLRDVMANGSSPQQSEELAQAYDDGAIVVKNTRSRGKKKARKHSFDVWVPGSNGASRTFRVTTKELT